MRSVLNKNALNSQFATATITPIKPIEEVPNTVELDKLYKRVELEMRGIDPAVLLSYSWFCIAAASNLGIEVTKRYNHSVVYSNPANKPTNPLM